MEPKSNSVPGEQYGSSERLVETPMSTSAASGGSSSRIDPDGPLPVYHQLKTAILHDIVVGIYRPGDRLPTEHQLCEIFDISRTPVHRALTELAAEGVVVRQRRAGTFVQAQGVARAPQLDDIRVVVSEQRWSSDLMGIVPQGLGLEVDVVEFTELKASLSRAVAEGTAPDVASIDEAWIAEFADNGFLLPLDELDPGWIESDFSTDFVSTIVTGRRHNGHVYAIPEEINVAGLWCSRDHLERVGVEVPTTWVELAAAAAAIQRLMPNGDHAFAMPGGRIASETTTYCLLAILASNGVAIVDEGVRLDSGAAVNALRLLRSLVEEGAMTADVTGYHWLKAPELLGSGKVALTAGGSYEAAHIANASGLSLDEVPSHFVFVPFPAGPSGRPATVAGGMAYAIFRQSKEPARAMWLLRQIVAPEALAERASGRPTIPPRHTAINRIASSSRFVAETAELFTTAVMRPGLATWGIVTVQLQDMLESVLTGKLRPAAAVERTAEVIGAITGLDVVHD